MALVSLPHAPMVGFKRNALSIVRGVYNEYDVEIQNDNGSPVDLTGLDVFLTAYKQREITEDKIHYITPILALSRAALDIDVTAPTEGKLTAKFLATKTETIDPDLYWYDLWYVDGTRNNILVIDKAELKIRE